MGEGLIVRNFGGSVQTLEPTILDFSTISVTSVKFKLRNNDASSATLVYRFNTPEGDGGSVFLAFNEISDEIIFTVPEFTTPSKLFVTANVTGKVKSNVVEQEFILPTFSSATGGTTAEYNENGRKYRSHTFTSNGTFQVTALGNETRNQIDYLIISGGGQGGTTADQSGAGGGGGAGGFRTTVGTQGGLGVLDNKAEIASSTYSIIVGAGGSGVTANNIPGGNGGNSEIQLANAIVALGGGGGATKLGAGADGGSGGGGTSPIVGGKSPGNGTVNQGFAGGVGGGGADSTTGGGGGAASETGKAGISQQGGDGGAGLGNTLRDGTSETRAGGGGGGLSLTGGPAGFGGDGGGGNGGQNNNGQNGTVNTGSGGGGSGRWTGNRIGGNGGSGIVIIRYEIAPSV